MATIWIVEGSTGEYSDRREWPVAAYRDEIAARTHVELANAYLRERGWHVDADYVSGYAESSEANPYDPRMDVSYTGTAYGCYPVELRDAPPTPEVKG